MPWLVLALAAALVGAWYAFTHRMQPVALLLLPLAFGLVFVIGRRIEAGRDADWRQAARQLHASFLAEPQAQAMLRAFGRPAPWDDWAGDGPPRCPRAVDGRAADPPFAVLHVRYPVREARGEEQPEHWREVALAVVRLARPRPPGALVRADAGAGYEAEHNGEFVFVWRTAGPGTGEVPTGPELAQLLQQARQAAQRL